MIAQAAYFSATHPPEGGPFLFAANFYPIEGGLAGGPADQQLFARQNLPCPAAACRGATESFDGRHLAVHSQNACRLTTNARQPGVRNGKPSPPALRRTDPARHPRDKSLNRSGATVCWMLRWPALATIEGKGFSSLRTSSRVFACAASCFTVSMYAKLFGRHFGSGDPVRYLLEGDVARIVRTAMIWFFVDAER